MTEAEAKAWLKNVLHVSRETEVLIETFLEMLIAENSRQNLISKASEEYIWSRHVVDSAQLMQNAQEHGDAQKNENGSLPIWMDLGTGAGFPGIIIAILGSYHVHMVESRTRRVAFLNDVIVALGLENRAIVHGTRLETLKEFPVSVISARAFAPLSKILALSTRFSTKNTLWLLPKGKNAVKEYQSLSKNHQNMFHVEQSITDEEAGILIGKTPC